MEFIREAMPGDKEPIYQLITALEETDIDRKRFSEIYDTNLSNPSIYYLVYHRDDTLLGFISLHVQKLLHHTANIAEIQELVVDQASRGTGVGKCLFETAKKVSRENNCLQIEVCCNQRRQHSHVFYQSLGMTNNHYKFCLHL